MVLPPLTLMTCPVTKAASAVARYATIEATSVISAALPMGMTLRNLAASAGNFSAMVAKMHHRLGKTGEILLENGGAYNGGCFVLRLP